MALKLKGSTSGFVAIDCAAEGGNNTLILPSDNGVAGAVWANNVDTAGVATCTSITINKNGDLTVPGTVSVGGTITYEDVTNVDSVGIITARSGVYLGATGSGTLVQGGASGIGINTDSPAYEIDVSNTSGGADPSIRLLNVGTASTNDTVFRSQINGTTASNYIYFGDATDTNAGQIIYSHSSDAMRFFTNGNNERARIDSAGKVGIGTDNIRTTSAATLEIGGVGGTPTPHLTLRRLNSVGNGNDLGLICFAGDGTGAVDGNRYGAQIASKGAGTWTGSSYPADLIFRTTAASSTSASERLRISAAGLVGIGSDSPTANYRLTLQSSTSPHSPLFLNTTEYNYNTNLTFARTGVEKWTIGNSTDDDFRFVSGGTSGTERFRITSDGDVGIGTDNPFRRLQVTDYGTHGAVRIEGSGNTNRSGIEFYRETSAGIGKGGAAIWVESDTSSTDGKLRFGTASNSGIQSQNTNMILDHNGHLGIGTDNPNQDLTIYADGPNFRMTHTGNTNQKNSAYVHVDETGMEFNTYQEVTATRRPFIFKQYTTEVARILADGKFGIGTSAPANLLQVEGSAPVIAIRDTASYSAYSNGGKLYFQGKDSDGNVKTFGGIKGVSQSSNNGQLRLQTRTGGTLYDRLVINASGQATHTYDIGSDGDAGLILNTDDAAKAPSILFRANSENRARLHVTRRSGDGGIVTLQVAQADNTNNLVNVFTSQCATSGDTTPDLTLGGNLVLASGQGIDFSATGNSSGTVTSELLDDYEYGSFDPFIEGSTTAGSVSYGAQYGFYVKIGRLVQVYVDFTVSTWSGAAGNQRIGGFPFTKNELSGQAYYYEGVATWYVVNNLTNSKPCYTGYMGDNAVLMNMYSGDTCQTDSAAPVNVTGRASFSFTYTTSS